MAENTNEEQLLLEQVFDVLEFTKAMNGGTLFTPDLINSRLQDINLNPIQASAETLSKAMKSPKTNEKQLRAFSQDFEIQSMVYKRLIAYLANMLSFDITYVSNVEPKEYNKPRYKSDLKYVEDFLDKFEYKQEFRIAVREMIRNDAFFGCMRKTENKYVLQELPPEYCKITGRWEGGFIFSFNLMWFNLPGVDVELYDDFFIEAFRNLSLGNNNNYDTGLMQNIYNKSARYGEWIEVPVDIGVVFKLSPELATQLPYFTPLFNDLVLQPLIRELQKNIDMAAASRLLSGEVPMLSKEIKATVRDSIAVSPKLLGQFMALVKSALSDSIKLISAPLKNIQAIEFESDHEMYDSFLRTALASSGVNTNLIFSSSVKPNAIETQLSLNVDEQMMSVLYEQFDLFMNYHCNKGTERFKFLFSFEGTDFSVNRGERHTVAMGLFDKGMIMPQKIAASLGMKPRQFRKHLEEANSSDFMSLLMQPDISTMEKESEIERETLEISAEIERETVEASAIIQKKYGLTPPKTSGTSTPKKPASSITKKKKPTGNDKGRPRKSLGKLGEEGARTRETGQNVAKGGKIKV